MVPLNFILMLDILCQNTIRTWTWHSDTHHITDSFQSRRRAYPNENILIGMGWSWKWDIWVSIDRRYKHGFTNITTSHHSDALAALGLTQALDCSLIFESFKTEGQETQKWTKCLILADSDQERRCRIECCGVAYPLATRPVAGFYQNFLREYYVDWQI